MYFQWPWVILSDSNDMEHRAASLRQLSQVRIYTEYAIMKAVKVQYTNYHTHTRTRARGSMRVILDAFVRAPKPSNQSSPNFVHLTQSRICKLLSRPPLPFFSPYVWSAHPRFRKMSVCLYVTHRYSVDTAENILKIVLPRGSPTMLVLLHRTGWQYSDGNFLNGGVECNQGGMKKITIFDQHIALSRNWCKIEP